MAIPDFQLVMRPLLDFLLDKQPHHVTELYTLIADHFGLTEEEKVVRLPSNSTTYLASRVSWALSHMKAAGLVESPQRARYQITNRGEQIYRETPKRVDMTVLNRFPEYVVFRTPRVKEEIRATESTDLVAAPVANPMDPEEAMAQGYQELRAALSQEILEKIKQSSPQFFEQLVVDVLLAMGYGGSQRDAG